MHRNAKNNPQLIIYHVDVLQVCVLSSVLGLLAIAVVKTSKNIQEENKVKIMKTLINLSKHKEYKLFKHEKLSSCSFTVEEPNEEQGVCTPSGACRFQGLDYMYQGGCGKHSGWGSFIIHTTKKCSMMVIRSREVKGKCTNSGHCWNAYHLQLFHSECIRVVYQRLPHV